MIAKHPLDLDKPMHSPPTEPRIEPNIIPSKPISGSPRIPPQNFITHIHIRTHTRMMPSQERNTERLKQQPKTT